jgi:hypothetical protein
VLERAAAEIAAKAVGADKADKAEEQPDGGA